MNKSKLSAFFSRFKPSKRTEIKDTINSAVGTIVVNSAEASLEKIMREDGTGDITGYTYQEYLAMYVTNGLAYLLVDLPVKLAGTTKFVNTFVGDSQDKFLERTFAKYLASTKAIDKIFHAKRLSRLYGISYGCFLSAKKDNALPLDIEDSSTFLQVFDPMIATGLIECQNPLSPHWLQVCELHLRDVGIHPSRFFAMYNGHPLHLRNNTASRNWAPPSCLQRAWGVCSTYEDFPQILRYAMTKAASIVVSRGESQPPTALIMEEKQAFIKRLKESVQPVIDLPKGSTAENLTMTGASDVLSTVLDLLLQEAAMSSDVPAQELKGMILTRGLNNGESDLEALTRYNQVVVETLVPMHEWVNKTMLFLCFNEGKLQQLNAVFGCNKTLSQWRLDILERHRFSYEISHNLHEEMMNKRMSARLKIIMMLGQVLDNPAWIVEEVNKTGFFNTDIGTNLDSLQGNSSTVPVDKEGILGTNKDVD